MSELVTLIKKYKKGYRAPNKIISDFITNEYIYLSYVNKMSNDKIYSYGRNYVPIDNNLSFCKVIPQNYRCVITFSKRSRGNVTMNPIFYINTINAIDTDDIEIATIELSRYLNRLACPEMFLIHVNNKDLANRAEKISKDIYEEYIKVIRAPYIEKDLVSAVDSLGNNYIYYKHILFADIENIAYRNSTLSPSFIIILPEFGICNNIDYNDIYMEYMSSIQCYHQYNDSGLLSRVISLASRYAQFKDYVDEILSILELKYYDNGELRNTFTSNTYNIEKHKGYMIVPEINCNLGKDIKGMYAYTTKAIIKG